MSSHRALQARLRASYFACAATFAILGTWTTVLAQETTGGVEGTVTGLDGKPLANIEVLATKPSPLVARKAITNQDGAYRFPALPLGEYEIVVRDPWFEPATARQVVVRLGQTTSVPPLKLSAPGSVVEQVEVVARAPLIDPMSTTTGGNITADVFDGLPVQRDHQSIATLLPNVSVSYLGDPVNFAGATGMENRYFVDGIEMTEPARGLGGMTLPPDFIQEVQVKTGGYEAEYRSALGGMVNVVTPSGSDAFSGKLIGYWTSHVVSEDPKQSSLALQRRDFAQYDVGFSLSGPLVKERAWFFLAYDPGGRHPDPGGRILRGLFDGAPFCWKSRLAGRRGEQPRADCRGRPAEAGCCRR